VADSWGDTAEIRFSIVVHDGCWDGFRFLKVESRSDTDKSSLVTCAQYWQDGLVLWRSAFTEDFQKIPNFAMSAFTAEPLTADQSYVLVGSLDTCIQPNELLVQQCEAANGFASFTISFSRNGADFGQLATITSRSVMFGSASNVFFRPLGELIQPEILSACLSSSSQYNVALAAPGDVLTVEVLASRDVQAPVITVMGRTAQDVSLVRDTWTGTVTVGASDPAGLVQMTVEVNDPDLLSGSSVIAQTPNCAGDIVADTAPPQVVSMSWNVADVTRMERMSLLITMSEPLLNFHSASVLQLPVGMSVQSTAAEEGGLEYIVRLLAEMEGAVKVHIAAGQLQDLAGNTNDEEAVSPSIIYDASPPETFGFSASVLDPSGAPSTIHIAFTAADALSQVQGSFCQHIPPPGGPALMPVWRKCNSPVTLDMTRTIPGNHSLEVYSLDVAGNFEYPPQSFSWSVSAGSLHPQLPNAEPTPVPTQAAAATPPPPTATPTPSRGLSTSTPSTTPLVPGSAPATPTPLPGTPLPGSPSAATPTPTPAPSSSAHFTPPPSQQPPATLTPTPTSSDSVVLFAEIAVVAPASEPPSDDDLQALLAAVGAMSGTVTEAASPPTGYTAVEVQLVFTDGAVPDVQQLEQILEITISSLLSIPREVIAVQYTGSSSSGPASQRSANTGGSRRLLQGAPQIWLLLVREAPEDSTAALGTAVQTLLVSAEMMATLQMSLPEILSLSTSASQTAVKQEIRITGRLPPGETPQTLAAQIVDLVQSGQAADQTGLTASGVSTIVLSNPVVVTRSTPTPSATDASAPMTPSPSTPIPTAAPTPIPTEPTTQPPTPVPSTADSNPPTPVSSVGSAPPEEEDPRLNITLVASIAAAASVVVALALIALVLLRRRASNELQRIGSRPADDGEGNQWSAAA